MPEGDRCLKGMQNPPPLNYPTVLRVYWVICRCAISLLPHRS